MITIIIPTFNRHSSIDDLLMCLKNQTCLEFTVSIVDQSVTPYNINSSLYPFNVKVHHTPHFRSPILARDFGYHQSDTNLFLFLDDDMRPSSDIIHNSIMLAERFQNIPFVIGGVSSIRQYSAVESFIRNLFHRGLYHDPRQEYFYKSTSNSFYNVTPFLDTFYISAGIMLINKSALSLSAFPTQFQKHILGGDIYFGLSSRKRGVSVMLSNFLRAAELPDITFDFKSIKKFRKVRLSLHSAYILLKLDGVTAHNLYHFFLRCTFILASSALIIFR